MLRILAKKKKRQIWNSEDEDMFPASADSFTATTPSIFLQKEINTLLMSTDLDSRHTKLQHLFSFMLRDEEDIFLSSRN